MYILLEDETFIYNHSEQLCCIIVYLKKINIHSNSNDNNQQP